MLLTVDRLEGFLGLSECFLFGTVSLGPISVRSLDIHLAFTIHETYVGSTHVLWTDTLRLLENEKIGNIQLPFVLSIPSDACLLPDLQIESFSFHASHQLSVSAELVSKSFPFPSTTHATVGIPFLYHDPVQIQKLLYSLPKIWKSGPAAHPCEYYFDLQSDSWGPGEDLILDYRIALSSEAERAGTRISQIFVTLKENQTAGDCFGNTYTVPCDIVKWRQDEYSQLILPKEELLELKRSGSDIVLMGDMSRQSQIKPILPSQPLGGSSSDGLYAESQVRFRIPYSIHPTTIAANRLPETEGRHAVLTIQHVLLVEIELSGYESRMMFKVPVQIATVSKSYCLQLLQTHPHILPTLDYDHVVGGDIWVPEYSPGDPMFPTKAPEYFI
jgi:hypothetical protein